MLSLQKISKSYDKQKVLQDLSLDIEEGEFVVLVGPSGCGKSTIIRCIAGLEEIDSGEIGFAEQRIDTRAPKDRDLSMVFQNYALYPHKTVADNIAFPLKMQDLEPVEIQNKVKKIAEQLEIGSYLDRKPGELSGGQRQRVALARAMVKAPKIFLMDEPLSNLDAKLRSQMRKVIFDLHKKSQGTFVYVTHDQVEALTLGDRIVVLDQGEVQQVGTPQEIYDQPQNTFVASFVGSPPCNLFELESEPEQILGLRPEFLTLQPGGESLQVRLESTELLGNEYLLHCELDNSTRSEPYKILARISKQENKDKIESFQEEQQINLYYNRQSLYYFDRMSKQRKK